MNFILQIYNLLKKIFQNSSSDIVDEVIEDDEVQYIEVEESEIEMSKVTFLLDAGHGGLVPDGSGSLKYATAPSKMHVHRDGLTMYEGVYNRQVIDLVKRIMDIRGMNYIDVVDSDYDVSLDDRIRLSNKIHSDIGNTFYFSHHGNASPNHNARGFEIYTSKGTTKSDKGADIIGNIIKNRFEHSFRADYSDGEIDKDVNFKVLRETDMPSVLLESLFFDNYKDAIVMNDVKFQLKLATAIVDGFEIIERDLY